MPDIEFSLYNRIWSFLTYFCNNGSFSGLLVRNHESLMVAVEIFALLFTFGIIFGGIWLGFKALSYVFRLR